MGNFWVFVNQKNVSFQKRFLANSGAIKFKLNWARCTDGWMTPFRKTAFFQKTKQKMFFLMKNLILPKKRPRIIISYSIPQNVRDILSRHARAQSDEVSPIGAAVRHARLDIFWINSMCDVRHQVSCVASVTASPCEYRRRIIIASRRARVQQPEDTEIAKKNAKV